MSDLSEVETIITRLYSETIEQLHGPQLSRVYLYGGRGMGKTMVLRALQRRMGHGPSGKPEMLSGREWETAGADLAEHARELKNDDNLVLLVDDLDQLILLTALLKEETLEEMLLSFMPAIASQRGRLILSATYPPARLIDVLHEQPLTQVQLKTFSLVLQRFLPLPLDPWSAGWEERVGNLVREQLPRPQERSDVQKICIKVVLGLTGGHPALLPRALLEIRQLAQSSSSLGQWLQGVLDEDLGEPENLLQRHLEDHLARWGIIPLQRAIKSLEVEAPDAYAALKSLALGAIPPALDSLTIRTRLLDEGLIYKEPATGKYRIPGSLLKNELRQRADLDKEAAAQPAPTRPYLDPDPDFPKKRGYLVLPEETGLRRVLLSGGPWSILALLFENPGKTFSLEELTREPLNSPKAVRSAIQRLDLKLRDSKAGKIFENVYGQGYRLAQEEWRPESSHP